MTKNRLKFSVKLNNVLMYNTVKDELLLPYSFRDIVQNSLVLWVFKILLMTAASEKLLTRNISVNNF